MNPFQVSLFDTRGDDAALRSLAWGRLCAVARADGPDHRTSLADARIAYDTAQGIAHQIADTSGNELCGYNRGTLVHAAIERQIRGLR